MDDTKSCENCKYYANHYYWYKTKLVNARCGHCFIRYSKPIVDCDQTCNKWESDSNKNERRKEELTTTLLNAVERITDIAAILKTNGQINNE